MMLHINLFILFRALAVITSRENLALSEHICLTNHTIGWDKSKIIGNRRYHLRLCLET